MWRTAQSLLHNNHKVVYSNAECASLVSTFCQFFVDKVNRIRDNIAAALQSTVRCVFTDRPYLGPKLSSFQMVADEEVRRLLSAMPSKSSPLDVLPCSLLKSCSDVFAPVIARLANLSMLTGKFPASYKRAQVLPLLKKAGLGSSLPGNYRPISNLSTVSKVLERLAYTPASSSARVSELQRVPVCLQEGAFHRNCSAGGSRWSLYGCRQQAGHCSDWPRLVGGVRYSRPRDTAPAAAV